MSHTLQRGSGECSTGREAGRTGFSKDCSKTRKDSEKEGIKEKVDTKSKGPIFPEEQWWKR